MKNFLIEKLGGYTKDEMLKGINYTIESVNELLDGKGVEWNIESRDLHFEGRAIAGEIGITELNEFSLNNLLKEASAKFDEFIKNRKKPAEEKKPVAKKRASKKVAKKVAKKADEKTDEKTVTKSN